MTNYSLKELVDLIHENEDVDFQTRSDMFVAIKYLQLKGFLLHFDDFDDHLNDLFFIHPQWLWEILRKVQH